MTFRCKPLDEEFCFSDRAHELLCTVQLGLCPGDLAELLAVIRSGCGTVPELSSVLGFIGHLTIGVGAGRKRELTPSTVL